MHQKFPLSFWIPSGRDFDTGS